MPLQCHWNYGLIFHLVYHQRCGQSYCLNPINHFLCIPLFIFSLSMSLYWLLQILDPVYPGQEFPLPLHLAEAGRMRWRPLGNSYLWSEAHNVSDLLSSESKIGFLRSFVCYPSHPSSDPFRCCLSLQHISLPAADRLKKSPVSHVDHTLNQSIQSCSKMLNGQGKSKNRFIHQMTLSTPLVINNYLPEAISLTIESGGITRTTLLSKVSISLFHHVLRWIDVVLCIFLSY